MNLDLKSTALSFDKFEEFVRALLNSGPTIPISLGNKNLEPKKDDFIHRYGKQGDPQRGIDLIGMVGGLRIVFQCKYHSAEAKNPRVGKTEADNAIKLAREKYPEAHYYVLVTNSSFTTGAIDSLTDAGWLKWGGEQLNDLLRTLPQITGYHLVCDHFGKPEADQLYPLGPDLLVTPKVALASRQDALAHRYACIGREKEIDTLTKALTGKKRQAVILSGDGGLGKSRILCEVLSRLDGKKWKPLILQKMEPSESSAKQVALLEQDNLIVGMDECHLEGFFREDISRAVLRHSKNGRLLLACRPEGIPKLRQTLRTQGWAYIEPLESFDGLKTMDADTMEQLAEEILGVNHPQAHQLAQLSCGNPLITVVGGEMLKNMQSPLRDVIHSDEFRTQVFKHLEDSYLKPLHEELHPEAKRILRLLAILSPCSEENMPSAAHLLEITEANLEYKIGKLRNAGLIRGSNESFRVIPDLFSDHLVREALGKKGDTGLLRRLMKSDLITNGGAAVFRNLAMARWGTDHDSTALDPLIQSLWKCYRRNFTDAYDKERDDLISSWRKWAVYLPDESLEFARLALEAKPNPGPEVFDWLNEEMESHYAKTLHFNAIHILSDLAKYHINHQERALELMWNHRDKETGSDGRDKPGAIAQVFGPKVGRSIESPLSALKWLANEARKPKTFRDWTERRTTDPAYYLGPAFATLYDASYFRGNVCHSVTKAFSLSNTAPLRDEAMEIIRHISMATVKGALNCLDLLQSNAEPYHSLFGGDPGKKWLKEFDQCRMVSLRMLLDIARHHDDVLVRFLIRKNIRQPWLSPDPSPEVECLRAQILDAIPETHDFNLARVLLSNAADEFSTKGESRRAWEEVSQYWNEFCDRVANEMISNLPPNRALPEVCEEIAGSMNEHGLEPSFHSLFQAFGRISAHHIEDLRKHIIQHPESHFGHHYGYLCLEENHEASDVKLAEGADLGRPDLYAAVCELLRRHAGDPVFPIAREKVASECRAARGALIDVVLRSVHFSWSNGSLVSLLLENLPWAHMSAEQLACVAKKMDHRSGGQSGLPLMAFPALLARLNELPWEAIAPMAGILRDACRKLPALTFDFFDERVRGAVDAGGDETRCVFPPSYECALSFPDVREIPGYEFRARTLFDALRADPDNPLLEQWFRIAVLNSGNLSVSFLGEWIETAADETNLMRVSEILTSEASRFAFSEPGLVMSLLLKAQSYSRDCLRRIKESLVYSLCNRMRGYTNGIPDDQRILNLAREHRERHAAQPMLRELFDLVVRHEEADASQHHREFMARNEESRRFD